MNKCGLCGIPEAVGCDFVFSGRNKLIPVFEEKQLGLSENLLNMGSFLKRKGQWVTAEDLSVESMRKAVKDLGL